MPDRQHPADDTLALFLAGELDDAADTDMRAHLRDCTACAERLHGEAALTHEIWRLRQSTRPCPGCARLVTPSAPLRCAHCGVALQAGGFRVVRVIAEHDHGRMYEAIGPSGGRVALKELVFARIPDVATLRALEREGETLRLLDLGPGLAGRVPRFVASFTEGEGVHLRCYLAQELVAGRSLLDLVGERRFDEAEVKRIARSVLETLVALQRASPPVLHRDIKPANLLVADDGQIVVVDFGSARATTATTNASIVGTFGYMPAEQLAGIVDTSTDVHALGATLVHLLTRRPPWEVLRERWQDRVHAAPAFVRVLERMVAPAGQRYRDAAAALHELTASSALRASSSTLAFLRPQARPLLLAAAALALVGALVAAVLVAAGFERAPSQNVVTAAALPPVQAAASRRPVLAQPDHEDASDLPPGRDRTRNFSITVEGQHLRVRAHRTWDDTPSDASQPTFLTVEVSPRDDTHDEEALRWCREWLLPRLRVVATEDERTLIPFAPMTCSRIGFETAARALYQVPVDARSLALDLGELRFALVQAPAGLERGARDGRGAASDTASTTLLRIGSQPLGEVFIDGDAVGRTPLSGDKAPTLTLGRHELVVVDREHRRHRFDIAVGADDPKNAIVVLLQGQPEARTAGAVEVLGQRALDRRDGTGAGE